MLLAGGPAPLSFSSVPLGDAATDAHALALADLDGDGDLDLVVGRGGHRPAPDQVWLRDGKGGFDGPLVLEGRRGTFTLAVGDLTGDGRPDLVSAGAYNRRAQLFAGNGRGGFELRGPLGPERSATRALVIADFDGDGDLDLAMGRKSEGRSGVPALGVSPADVVLLNDGSGAFPDSLGFGNPTHETIGLAAGDLDGDGDLDLAAAHGRSAAPRVFLNDGKAGFGVVRELGAAGRNTRAVALGDLDGDGDLDVVLGNWASRNRLFWNQGKGEFTEGPALGAAGPHTRSVALADFDGDGALDVVTGGLDRHNVVYRNEGDGTLSPSSSVGGPRGATWAVVAGDLDGDGRPDVAEADADGVVTLHRNRNRR